MITLTGPSDSQSDGASGSPPGDDRSGDAHRQLIGWLGFWLPWILVLIAAGRPIDPSARWTVLNSISAYYYTGAVAAFVGMLVALALFLLTYRGYDNKYGWVDRAAAVTAGVAALLVAFFPTDAPEGFPVLPWWTPPSAVVHYFSAIVLFAMFAVFCLWLFRLGTSDPTPPDKRRRNLIYVLCGIVILISMAWAGIAGWKDKPIFIPESLALTAFAASWLTKGRAPRTIANAVRKTLS
jgi:hypothetical protein